ncbi:MAG: SDR family NAD(P)-dependent oxidoreductase [Roseiflexaceae bacterium]|nr:SDR family NAD(P)-dependent oxidoreductase [Roseiflexaceae bacterium]
MTTTIRTALITGASSGIGAAAATTLAQHGWTVYATARRTEALAALAASGLHTLPLDVTDDQSMIAAVEQIESTHGAVDLLVNNAGFGVNGPVEELAMADIRRQFETNVFGLVRMSQLVLPGMRRKRSGRIINIGSVGGTFTTPGAGAYHASKWAVESFNDAMRFEVESFGVDVVLVQPTGVYTQFDKKITETMPDTGPQSPYAAFKANHARVTTQMFSGRNVAGIVQAEDVAKVILQAATVRRPRTRYKVGMSAHIYTNLRRIVSDRFWDRLMAMQFPMAADRST